MNHTDIDDDMNLDDAMFLDRMGHLQVQIDEKIQFIIDSMAQELFKSNPDDTLLARIQVCDVPKERSIKHVMVDDNIHGHLHTRIDMTGDVPKVFVEFKKVPEIAEDKPMQPKKTGFINFMRGKASA